LKHNCKVVLLASLIVCLILGILVAGCGGPSVTRVYLPPSWLASDFRLELKSDGTYVQRISDLEPKKVYSDTFIGLHDIEVPEKTYRGTFTVKDKRVILNGEPTEPAGVNSYKIVGRNLKGPYGVWVRKPAAKK
jgi:hypothetical protein